MWYLNEQSSGYMKFIFPRRMISFILISIFVLLPLTVCAQGNAGSRDTEAREKLEKILSSGEFSDKENSKSVLKTVGDMLKDFFEWLVEKAKSLMPGGKLPVEGKKLSSATLTTLSILGLVILLLFIMLFVYFISRNLKFSKAAKQQEDIELLTTLRDWNSLEQRALELSVKGDYRQGIRILYIAFLLKMNESNFIRIHKSKTNKQYMNELSGSNFSKIKEATDFTLAFNQYWYGNRNADREVFDFWYKKYQVLAGGEPL